MKKVPGRTNAGPPDEPAIIQDLRVLVEASRALRESVNEMVSHRPRGDLRAYLANQRAPKAPGAGSRKKKKKLRV